MNLDIFVVDDSVYYELADPSDRFAKVDAGAEGVVQLLDQYRVLSDAVIVASSKSELRLRMTHPLWSETEAQFEVSIEKARLKTVTAHYELNGDDVVTRAVWSRFDRVEPIIAPDGALVTDKDEPATPRCDEPLPPPTDVLVCISSN